MSVAELIEAAERLVKLSRDNYMKGHLEAAKCDLLTVARKIIDTLLELVCKFFHASHVLSAGHGFFLSSQITGRGPGSFEPPALRRVRHGCLLFYHRILPGPGVA